MKPGRRALEEQVARDLEEHKWDGEYRGQPIPVVRGHWEVGGQYRSGTKGRENKNILCSWIKALVGVFAFMTLMLDVILLDK